MASQADSVAQLNSLQLSRNCIQMFTQDLSSMVNLQAPFECNSGVKQGCKLAPTLYGIYAAVLLWLAYKDIKHNHSIKVRFRYDGDLFDLRRLKSKTKVLALYIREAEYADDVAIFSDTPAGLQILLTAYNALARKMGLCINTTKTETMCIGPEAEFFIDQTKLKNVDSLQVSWQLCNK